MDPKKLRDGSRAFRHPLDVALGSEATVRLLRALTTQTPGPMNAEEAARRTGLTPPGSRKAFERLVNSGLVHRVGIGPQKQFVLNAEHPLAEAVGDLFDAEERCFRDLLTSLRAGLGALPEIKGAWIVGPPSEPGAAVHVALVAESADLPWIGAEARRRVAAVEKAFDQIIEIDTYTEVDAPVLDSEAAISLAGVVPGTVTRGAGGPMTHDRIDRRSLEMARGVAWLIGEDPSVVARARRYLDDLIHAGKGTASGDLAEWRQLLDTYSTRRLQEFLVSASSRALRLRSSSPFLPILTSDEKARLLEFLEASR